MYDYENDFATDEREYDVNELERFDDGDDNEALSCLVTDVELIELEIRVVTERIALLERDALDAERDGDGDEYAKLCRIYDSELAVLDELKAELAETERINSLVFAAAPADFDFADDGDALASAGWGTDEDYGYHGDDDDGF